MTMHWTKITLVGTVMTVVLLGGQFGAAPSAKTSSSPAVARLNAAAPLLVLTPPAYYASGSNSNGAALSSTTGSPGILPKPKTAAISSPVDASQDVNVSAAAPLPAMQIAQAAGFAPDAGSLSASDNPGAQFYRTGAAPVPETGAHVVLVSDTGGNAYAAQNDNARWPMASLTKLMTAVVVLGRGQLNDQVEIPASVAGLDDARGIFHAGEIYSADDLLRAMLVYSSNVAAEALAAHYGRSGFLAAMNAQAQEWGMTDTFYGDPSGLSSANQSTARDLALLAEHVLSENSQIFSITRTPQITVTELASNSILHIKNINEFAGRPDFIGGKTGYTDDAQGNLLSMFRYRGNPIIIVILGTANDDRFKDTSTLLSWFEQNYK